MRRVLSLILAVVFLAAGVAIASDITVQSNGTYVKQASGVNFKGPSVSDNGVGVDVDFSSMTGAQTIVGAVDITGATEVNGTLTVDGTIYTAKIMSDGAIYGGRATSDPCGTLGAGYIFFNNTTGAPCFCNNLGVDLSLYDGTTACF